MEQLDTVKMLRHIEDFLHVYTYASSTKIFPEF